MALQQLCSVDDIPEDEPLRVDIDGHGALAVFRVDGEVYVMEDRCAHAGASLADEGLLEGYVIECGWHEARFDIRSGEPLSGPCSTAMKVYRVTLQDGGVMVDLSAD